MSQGTKAVAVKETTALTTNPLLSEGVAIDLNNIVLPSLTLRQNSYKNPAMKPFKPGDIILRPQNTVVASEGKSVLFVPLRIQHLYRVYFKDETDTPRTVRWEHYLEGKEWEFTEGGQTLWRDRCFVADILLREGLDNQAKMMAKLAADETVDPDDFVLPIRVTFRGQKGYWEGGKVLAGKLEILKVTRQSPASLCFELKTVEHKNDKGIWFDYVVSKPADKALQVTPKELRPTTDFWSATLASTGLKAHEDMEDLAAATTAEPVNESKARF